MADFKKGDVVTLKSGGPLMTIRLIRHDGSLLCMWFDSKKERKEDDFDPDTVKLHIELTLSDFFGQK
jgi:uncharacterized protein YodC (DUF2158 family)